MLALTRKRGESIIIGDNIEVVILGVQGEQVKVGIIAPKAISIHRKEIYDQIQLENMAAMKNTDISAVKSLQWQYIEKPKVKKAQEKKIQENKDS